MFAAPLLLPFALLAAADPPGGAPDDARVDGPGGVRVSGAVVDAAGGPVAGRVTGVSLFAGPAVARAAAGADGAFTLTGLPPGRTGLHAVAADGRAGWGFVMLGEDDAAGATVAVGPVGGVALSVRGPDGAPAAGATVTGVNWTDARGEGFATPVLAAAAGLAAVPADAAGRLTVPGLPVGAAVTVALAHPAAARVEAGPFVVPAAGATAEPPAVALPAGEVVTVRVAPAAGAGPLPTGGWELRARGGGPGGAMIVDEPWPLAAAADGAVSAEVRLPPGEGFVMLSHPDFALAPDRVRSFDFPAGSPPAFALTALPRAPLTGRLVDPAGAPVPLASAYALTRFAGAEEETPLGRGWAYTGSDHEPGEDGRFAVRAGVGEAAVEVRVHPVHGAFLPTTAGPVTLTAAGADVGDVLLRPLPTLTGTVVGPGGAPVPHALVGPGPNLEYYSQTVRADGRGRFAYPLGGIAPAAGPPRAELVAFAPAAGPSGAGLFGEATVPLTAGVEPGPVRIELAAAPVPPPPAPEDGWRDWNPDAPAPGSAAPAWAVSAGFAPDGADDPDPPTLESLRGRWVLLDLRTTWCAPCRTSEPTLHAVAAAYADRLTIVEVYDRSDTAPAVRAYLADRPAAGPVLRDADGGPTHAAYGVRGVPTRALIDPAGRVRFHSGYDGAALRPRLADTVRRFLAAERRGD